MNVLTEYILKHSTDDSYNRIPIIMVVRLFFFKYVLKNFILVNKNLI